MIGGFESRQGLGILLFTTASRPALGSTQLPIQRVPGVLPLGVKRPGCEDDHSPPSSAEVKECVELYLHSPNTPSWRGAQLKKSTGTTLPSPCPKCCWQIFYLFCVCVIYRGPPKKLLETQTEVYNCSQGTLLWRSIGDMEVETHCTPSLVTVVGFTFRPLYLRKENLLYSLASSRN
jgi:hypothetical protein